VTRRFIPLRKGQSLATVTAAAAGLLVLRSRLLLHHDVITPKRWHVNTSWEEEEEEETSHRKKLSKSHHHDPDPHYPNYRSHHIVSSSVILSWCSIMDPWVSLSLSRMMDERLSPRWVGGWMDGMSCSYGGRHGSFSYTGDNET